MTISFCSKWVVNLMNIEKESFLVLTVSQTTLAGLCLQVGWGLSVLPLGLYKRRQVGEHWYHPLYPQLGKHLGICWAGGRRLCWHRPVQPLPGHSAQTSRTRTAGRPRQPPAYLCCLMGWVPLSGDKASGKGWGPEKLDSITLSSPGPGCLSGLEYCGTEKTRN